MEVTSNTQGGGAREVSLERCLFSAGYGDETRAFFWFGPECLITQAQYSEDVAHRYTLHRTGDSYIQLHMI